MVAQLPKRRREAYPLGLAWQMLEHTPSDIPLW